MLNEINTPEDLKKIPTSKFPELAQEIRDFLLNHVSKTGGHLASSLGVVELTIALHYVFNSPKDKIVWDVGHQAYAHKILTGRKDKFDNLRKLNGLSGFPKRSESPHDQFDVGHASTSISAALGIAKARDLQNLDFSVVAIIGDGSLTGGLALEGLNQSGYLQPDMLVILNDNKMSISANVGALSCQSKRIKNTEVYQKVKKSYYEIYEEVRQELKPKLELIKQQMKNLTTPGLLFEKLGMNYTGPIDGHNIELLIQTLEKLKSKKGSQLLHIITKKGKGYIHAEENATKFHGISKFDIENGAKIGSSGLTYTKAFSDALIKIAKNNENIVAITAAMAAGTGLDKFYENYPERFFDVGIAEEHAVTFAAGLAVQGIKPVVAIYSTFLQRSYDQLIHDVCLQNLPVVFALDRGGLVGSDGPTHHGCFDLSYLRHMPNMVVMAPKDENELGHMLFTAISHNGPIALRYPRGEGLGVAIEEFKKIDLGKAELLRRGETTLILAIGSMVQPALEAGNDIDATVVNARFIKPLDKELILELAGQHDKVITVEENSIRGGFGSAVAELFQENNLYKPLKIIGIPDKFIEMGTMQELRESCGLTKESILDAINEN